jgi:hypothetical protein
MHDMHFVWLVLWLCASKQFVQAWVGEPLGLQAKAVLGSSPAFLNLHGFRIDSPGTSVFREGGEGCAGEVRLSLYLPTV